MVQMAGLERVSCSMPAIIRVFRLVLGAPGTYATGAAVWDTVRTRRGERKLDFVKVTKSGPPRAGPRPRDTARTPRAPGRYNRVLRTLQSSRNGT